MGRRGHRLEEEVRTIPNEVSRAALEAYYEAAAQKYLRKLKPEDFAEPGSEGAQRGITLASLSMIRARRPEIQYFNNLLVQYPPAGRKRNPGQVLPDNMIVVHPTPLRVLGHYSLPLQPFAPSLVVDYVCEQGERKHDASNRKKYEEDLKIPYYLRIYPDAHELTLLRHDGTRYAPVLPDAAGRYPIPELEMAVSLVEGQTRYWSRGEMLPLMHELFRQLQQAKQEAARQRRLADESAREYEDRARLRAEVQALRDAGGKAS